MTDTTNQHRLNWTDENWATAIKIAAVLVAVPRWIGALLEADGVPLMLTPETAPAWGLFSAVASAGMALVEGVAFWYTLRAWRNNGGKPLLVLVVLSMAAFGVVLTPYIMANVTGNPLREILQGDWLVAWSSCVSLSTILIVASVGYAQPRKQAQAVTPPATEPHDEPHYEPQAQPAETINTPAVLVPIADSASEAQPATASDVLLAYYAAQPDASQTQAAQHVAQVMGKPYSRQAVKAQLDRLERDGLIARNGHVKVVK